MAEEGTSCGHGSLPCPPDHLNAIDNDRVYFQLSGKGILRRMQTKGLIKPFLETAEEVKRTRRRRRRRVEGLLTLKQKVIKRFLWLLKELPSVTSLNQNLCKVISFSTSFGCSLRLPPEPPPPPLLFLVPWNLISQSPRAASSAVPNQRGRLLPNNQPSEVASSIEEAEGTSSNGHFRWCALKLTTLGPPTRRGRRWRT